MLTPARKANSRWRGSPGTSGSIGWPSGRIAQAPARSFEVIRIEETPSPARAGRVAAPPRSLRRQRLDPELAGGEAAGEVLQQEERLGQHVIARHRLQLGNVERGRIWRSASMPGPRVSPPGPGGAIDRVARVEQHRTALLHVGVDARQRFRRRLRRARHDRPVDQRVERSSSRADVDADRIASFQRGALGQEERQPCRPGLADRVHLGVAGDRRRRAWSRCVDFMAKSARRSRRRRARLAAEAARQAAVRAAPDGTGTARPSDRGDSSDRRARRAGMARQMPPREREHDERIEQQKRERGEEDRSRRSCGSPTR